MNENWAVYLAVWICGEQFVGIAPFYVNKYVYTSNAAFNIKAINLTPYFYYTIYGEP